MLGNAEVAETRLTLGLADLYIALRARMRTAQGEQLPLCDRQLIKGLQGTILVLELHEM